MVNKERMGVEGRCIGPHCYRAIESYIRWGKINVSIMDVFVDIVSYFELSRRKTPIVRKTIKHYIQSNFILQEEYQKRFLSCCD